MEELKYKYAIGCLVQWYEIEMIDEYIQSLKHAVSNLKNSENVLIDFTFVENQDLEKVNCPEGAELLEMNALEYKFETLIKNSLDKFNVRYRFTKKLVTIADYRREFNDAYCDEVDVIMWGESDSLIPKQTFEILDLLHHNNIKQNTHKYIAFFGTCKMWDESWKPIEHNDFTEKPFIEGDTENWWGLRYTMNQKEMDKINDKVTDLDIRIVNPYKFNGCGLVISSDVIKSGVNIPKSVFFVHEDTAFQNSLIKMFGGNIPQFIIKNILLVHNRKHSKKRSHIKGEEGIDKTNTGELRKVHKWYENANKMCEHNAYNMFNQGKTYTWKDVFK